jgi:hypothetical protein
VAGRGGGGCKGLSSTLLAGLGRRSSCLHLLLVRLLPCLLLILLRVLLLRAALLLPLPLLPLVVRHERRK